MIDLDKIRRLLERAAHESTPVEEARTSAVIAAKLIIEHEVELRLPGTGPGPVLPFSSEVSDIFREWFRKYPTAAQPPNVDVRTIYTATCTPNLNLRCACCGAVVRHGSKFGWVGERVFIDEEKETIARVAHESCLEHWRGPKCRACGKRTDRVRATRERLKNQRRDPPGTVRATASGYCFCCGSLFDVDEKIVVRGFVMVHYRCAAHFNQERCTKCGGGARF